MEFENLNVSVENRVAVVRINHPPANALNAETLSELSTFLDYAEGESDIKVILITGEGRFFVAGADITKFPEAFDDISKGKELAKTGQQVFDRMEFFPKPIIAAINGACLGGGLELALGCHLRIASEKAQLGFPELKLGLIPGFGGTQRLARVTNRATALELILSSKFIDGREAERLGIVNHTVAPENLMSEALKLAEEIALNKSAVSVSAALKAVTVGAGLILELGEKLEAELFGRLFCTDDAKEGITAFLEKRQAQFKDQ